MGELSYTRLPARPENSRRIQKAAVKVGSQEKHWENSHLEPGIKEENKGYGQTGLEILNVKSMRVNFQVQLGVLPLWVWRKLNGIRCVHWLCKNRPQLTMCTSFLKKIPSRLLALLWSCTLRSPWISLPHPGEQSASFTQHGKLKMFSRTGSFFLWGMWLIACPAFALSLLIPLNEHCSYYFRAPPVIILIEETLSWI